MCIEDPGSGGEFLVGRSAIWTRKYATGNELFLGVRAHAMADNEAERTPSDLGESREGKGDNACSHLLHSTQPRRIDDTGDQRATGRVSLKKSMATGTGKQAICKTGWSPERKNVSIIRGNWGQEIEMGRGGGNEEE